MEKILKKLGALPDDKCKHSFYGSIIFLIAYFVLSIFLDHEKAVTVSFIVVIVIAACKELYDALHPKRHEASIKDFIATAFLAFFIAIAIIIK